MSRLRLIVSIIAVFILVGIGAVIFKHNKEMSVEEIIKQGTSIGKEKEDQQAFERYTQEATKDNTEAMYQLGLMYKQGQGTYKDEEQAIAWLKKAADLGHEQAMLELGFLYAEKNYFTAAPLEENDLQSQTWFKKAAANNNVAIIYKIGMSYCCNSKYKVKSDNERAVYWLERAANLDNVEAMLNLGMVYENKMADTAQAVHWLEKATTLGNRSAMHKLIMIYAYGTTSFPKNITQAKVLFEQSVQDNPDVSDAVVYQVYQDKKEVLQWFKKRAEQGNSHAMYILATLYSQDNKPENKQLALQWFERFAQISTENKIIIGNAFFYKTSDGVEQDYKQAMQWYLKAAGEGNKQAMYQIGVIYLNGLGVPQSSLTAKQWFNKYTDNSASNMYSLGKCYLNSADCLKDTQQAIDWFQKAAALGSEDAMNELARLYADDWYGVKDKLKSIQWYKKAANTGSENAMYDLAWEYARGKGILPDQKQATYWFEKYAKNDTQKMIDIGFNYIRDRNIPANLEQGMQWYQRAANRGDKNAMLTLAVLYSDKDDTTQALYWLKKAASLGSEEAMYRLGILYGDGKIVPKDRSQAMQWFEAYAKMRHERYPFREVALLFMQGSVSLTRERVGVDKELAKLLLEKYIDNNNQRMIDIASQYDRGYSFPKDTTQADYWYKKASANGSIAAIRMMGDRYFHGHIVPKDTTQAIVWYEKAADLGDTKAMVSVAEIYEDKKNLKQAVKWYLKAAYQDDVEAMYRLGFIYKTHNDMQQALYWLNQAANKDNFESMMLLATLYGDGVLIPKNYELAVQWFVASAKLENNQGILLDVASSFIKGGFIRYETVSTDIPLANLLLEKYANNDSDAMLTLGLQFDSGLGYLPKDCAQAHYWYQRAAKLGNEKAKQKLVDFKNVTQ